MQRTRLFTDADNTLWDTNSVFASAQVGLLRDIETEVRLTAPEASDGGLAFVRRIDQRIASSHPDHLRYPSVLLASTIARVLAGYDPEQAVDDACGGGDLTKRFARAVAQYERRLRAMPTLRDGVQEGLADLRRSDVPVTVLTEARLDRCSAMIEAHGLSRFISGVRSVRKDAGAYRALREHADEVRLVMVGDQLDRDVDAARRAGFLTIFFPGGFVPSWNGCSSITADHEIQRYDEIPPLLHR